MNSTPRILLFAGSTRTGSLHKKLARLAAAAVRNAGADATYIDLADYPLPIYDGDFEEANGIPQSGVELRKLFRSHDGFLIASPEYNHSFSALLKNTLDWVSRRADGEDYRPYFANKVAGLLAASPGRTGGARGLPHLRQVLTHLGVHVVDEQVLIPRSGEAFSEEGLLRDAAHQAQISHVVREVLAAIDATVAA
jgi:chromate reductase, NAD(P)H dehydrogenase (quinone)